MKLNKIAILVKTSLQFDGRVISQIDNLTKKFNNTEFKIFLLSDAHYDIKFNNNCKVDDKINLNNVNTITMYWPTAYIASIGNKPEVLALIEKIIINPSALFCNNASA